MPSVAVCVCKDCGCVDELVLVDRHMLTSMPPCKCGGQMQVSRVFYDQRPSQELGSHGPGARGDRQSDACFDPDGDLP